MPNEPTVFSEKFLSRWFHYETIALKKKFATKSTSVWGTDNCDMRKFWEVYLVRNRKFWILYFYLDVATGISILLKQFLLLGPLALIAHYPNCNSEIVHLLKIIILIQKLCIKIHHFRSSERQLPQSWLMNILSPKRRNNRRLYYTTVTTEAGKFNP